MVTDTDTLLDMPQEINSALEVLRENRVRLEKLMVTQPGYKSAHATAASSLAAAVKSLSAEARMWAEQLTSRAARATADQRTAACIRHLTKLPQGPRLAAYTALCESEARSMQPVPIKVAE